MSDPAKKSSQGMNSSIDVGLGVRNLDDAILEFAHLVLHLGIFLPPINTSQYRTWVLLYYPVEELSLSQQIGRKRSYTNNMLHGKKSSVFLQLMVLSVTLQLTTWQTLLCKMTFFETFTQ